jgi:uncharacterized coiled-coil protein SlyX
MSFNSKYGVEARACAAIQRGKRLVPAALFLLLGFQSPQMRAQSASAPAAPPATTAQAVEHLTQAIIEAQARVDAYQEQLSELRSQLSALQLQMAADNAASPPAPSAVQPAHAIAGTAETVPASLDEIRERQAIEESQIATHDVSKVETASKYPLKVSGLLLFNAFVNTRQVDVSASPTYALPGSGSTGLSLRQTVLGLDARGPHLFTATSHADLRVDFFANGTASNYSAGGVLRLRTAHAALDWKDTQAFVEVDRSILEPNEPSSLVAIAQPELAWAGNLWTWNPQAGLSHSFAISDSSWIKAEAALIDSSDPLPPGYVPNAAAVTQSERSRWPGSEARIAFGHGGDGTGPVIGAGGYFSPHRDVDGNAFDAWAGTMDLRLPLSRYIEMTANAYRGQALAGLGAGGFVYYYYTYADTEESVHALDDVGGWAQLKARAGQRVELNAGFGSDNPFSKEIQAAVSSSGGSSYLGIARNRSFYSNLIVSPSAYLIFSLEYRRFWTNLGSGPAIVSDVVGIGAGYRF